MPAGQLRVVVGQHHELVQLGIFFLLDRNPRNFAMIDVCQLNRFYLVVFYRTSSPRAMCIISLLENYFYFVAVVGAVQDYTPG